MCVSEIAGRQLFFSSFSSCFPHVPTVALLLFRVWYLSYRTVGCVFVVVAHAGRFFGAGRLREGRDGNPGADEWNMVGWWLNFALYYFLCLCVGATDGGVRCCSAHVPNFPLQNLLLQHLCDSLFFFCFACLEFACLLISHYMRLGRCCGVGGAS